MLLQVVQVHIASSLIGKLQHMGVDNISLIVHRKY